METQPQQQSAGPSLDASVAPRIYLMRLNQIVTLPITGIAGIT